ncbi:hypothetical protein G6009_00685 [Dietzia sp. SLG510A3-30A2]|nr:hypothetical protein [Dietzia sp. SLG510A3-30A2]
MSVNFTWKGGEVAAKLEAGKQGALRMAAEAVLGESNNRVPVREGDLRDSGKAAVSGDEAAVGYDTPYAARQHEEIGWNHPNGGQAKFLETALNDRADDVMKILATGIGRGLGL